MPGLSLSEGAAPVFGISDRSRESPREFTSEETALAMRTYMGNLMVALVHEGAGECSALERGRINSASEEEIVEAHDLAASFGVLLVKM